MKPEIIEITEMEIRHYSAEYFEAMRRATPEQIVEIGRVVDERLRLVYEQAVREMYAACDVQAKRRGDRPHAGLLTSGPFA